MVRRIIGFCAVVMLSGCGTAGSNRGAMTWEERYTAALQRINTAKTESEQFAAMPEAAKAAFEAGRLEEARAHAAEALKLTPRYQGAWSYGNAIHDAHMVLGRIALRQGDAATAKSELLQAGGTPGSPQLDSFGPNMSLARDLLMAKEVDTVVQYFQLCSRFWGRRESLELWTAQAKAGQVPDFGPNLSY